MTSLSRDNNRVTMIGGTSSVDGTSPVALYADPTTHRLLVDLSNISSHFQRDQFTSTNNQTVFTTTKTLVADMLMIVNGQVQAPSFDYTQTGNNYTLSNGIPAGLQVILLYIV